MADYVELDRRFRDATHGVDSETTALLSYAASWNQVEAGLPWAEVLSHRFVVVLGEPGSGKTAEFKAQVRLIDPSGTPRFFVRLDDLIQGSLDSAVGPDHAKQFQRWLDGSGEAAFFLDSVDESKYRCNDDFARALERLAAELGKSLSRIRIAISSRISEWQPQTDKDTVVRVFGLPGGNVGEDNSVKVLQIMPLDRSRVEMYAREKGGLNDPRDFVIALDKQHAWAFARRPVDVIPLFNYWNDHHRLGTLTELIEYGLQVSLAETENREKADVLSPAEARQGAEILAAAATFCKQFKFAVPDSGFVADAGALDTTSCLPAHWKSDMRRALLTRAVFDAATYGHIRFHHREALDYLAASWLAGLMNADCSLDALEDLLFQVSDGCRVLRPSLAPLAAWMAPGEEPWRGRLREWIKQSAPEILLQHGDGSGLPLVYRRQILSAIVARYQGRERVMLSWSAEALSRLASPELSDDVNAILGDASVAEDLKEDMLSLARHGAMRGCIPVAIEIAGMSEASDSLKSYAVALVRDIGNEADRTRLAAMAEQQYRFSTILCGRLCEALYPAAVDAKGIASLLERTEEVSRYRIDLPYYLKEHFEAYLTTERALGMLEEMLRLLDIPPLENDVKLSKRFLWTANLLPECLKKLLTQTRLDENQIDAASRAIVILEKAGRYSLLDSGLSRKSTESQDITALLARHPELTRRVFWNRCRRWKEKHGSYPRWYMPLELGNIELGLSTIDVEWLHDDACNACLLQDEQAFAARVLLDIPASLPDFLRRAVRLWRGGAIAHRAEVWRAVHQRLTKPFMALWYRQVIGKLADRYWWQRRYWDFQHRYEHLREQWMLHRRSHWLRTGKRWDWLAQLVNEAEPSLTNRSPQSWAPLQEKRGKRIAEAVRIGCEAFWSGYSPLLPHEKPEPNKTDARAIVGLAGLQSLWQRGALDFSHLSDAEVRAAARYGCEELNGLPEWFFALGQARPEAWLDVLFEAIRGEWETPPDQEHVNDVIAKLVWHGRPYWPVFAPGFLELLEKSDPPHPRVLEYALTILLSSMTDVSRFTALTQQRIADYGHEDRQFVLWLSIWMQTDASAALDYLDHLLASMPPLQADDLALRLCASMKQDRHDPSPSLAQPDYIRPEVLGRFIRLAYRHVRPEQDIDRAGKGVFSPGPRDHAQEFRSKLFELLSGSDQPEADAVLRSLLDALELNGQRDWILHLLDKRVERTADFEPWRQTEVRAFAQDHEIAPRSAHALFRIACRRLWDVKKEVEGVENSLRNAVRSSDDESVMQQWLQRQLAERAKGRYTIPKESEDDAGNRPDLRFDHPGITSVMVEMKLADMPRWTVEKLIDGLEKQLVGKYLLAHNAGYGIYIIGNSGRRADGWKDPVTGALLSFDEVTATLQQHARKAMESCDALRGLEVIAIDFSSPRKS